jgi:hypothetical protein
MAGSIDAPKTDHRNRFGMVFVGSIASPAATKALTSRS